MKKVYRTNPILVLSGRTLTGIALIVPIFIVGVQIKNFELNGMWIFCLTVSIVMLILGILTCKWFWKNCWGKLIIKNDCVIWKCYFCKTQKLYFKDIKVAKVCEFIEGNVVKNANVHSTNSKYILLSSDSNIIKKRIDKIDCCKGTIKFMLSVELGSTLNEVLPKPYNQAFSYFAAMKRKKAQKGRKKVKKENRG